MSQTNATVSIINRIQRPYNKSLNTKSVDRNIFSGTVNCVLNTNSAIFSLALSLANFLVSSF